MKKVSKMLLVILFAFAVLSFTACNDSNKVEIGDLEILNFDQYESLAVGASSDAFGAQKSNARIATAASMSYAKKHHNGGRPKLYGKNKHGEYEEIVFKENNKFMEAYGISAMQIIGGLIFIAYTYNYAGEVRNHIDYDYMSPAIDYLFVLDKQTGKLYNVIGECYFDWLIDSSVAENIFYGSLEFPEYNYEYNRIDYSSYFCRFEIADNKLEIVKYASYVFGDILNGYLMVDKFGNLYSSLSQYVITAEGPFKKFDNTVTIINEFSGDEEKISGEVKVAMNGIAYLNLSNKWFNEDGELVEATFAPSFIEHSPWDTCIYSKDGAYYYYSIFYDNICNSICKYEFINDTEFTVTNIPINTIIDIDEAIIIDDRIYFITEGTIYYISIEDGSSTQINSNCIFTKIEYNNHNLVFEGMDERLNHITGIITKEGDVEIGDVQSPQLEIIYVLPIN